MCSLAGSDLYADASVDENGASPVNAPIRVLARWDRMEVDPDRNERLLGGATDSEGIQLKNRS